jgi:hypothetical protein
MYRESHCTRHGSPVFHHVLQNNPERSIEEEVQERNFRDLRDFQMPAWLVVLNLSKYGYHQINEENRFLISNHMWFMPEADNVDEEIMLGRWEGILLSFIYSRTFSSLHTMKL